ncbi:MAG: O-methyltransferase [Acidobacteriota bacterium]
MSSGATIPYHLRQNKAIDRNLFVDLLARIGRYRNISDYNFVGFGGPFLEDFKQLHASLRIERMVSLERSEIVAARQRFNQPHSGVVTLKKTSGEYLNENDFEEPTIVWFDYTSPAELAIQLSEVELLVRKLYPGDIFVSAA